MQDLSRSSRRIWAERSGLRHVSEGHWWAAGSGTAVVCVSREVPESWNPLSLEKTVSGKKLPAVSSTLSHTCVYVKQHTNSKSRWIKKRLWRLFILIPEKHGTVLLSFTFSVQPSCSKMSLCNRDWKNCYIAKVPFIKECFGLGCLNSLFTQNRMVGESWSKL